MLNARKSRNIPGTMVIVGGIGAFFFVSGSAIAVHCACPQGPLESCHKEFERLGDIVSIAPNTASIGDCFGTSCL